ncbi:MAG: hypothetical protein OXC91_06960 [Rhodobacteraceae bacterium]|nr:hypothetical protein [Paracoccaceae bacterium]
MLRCLIGLAEKERGQPFAIEEFFTGITDDIFVGTVGGIFRIKEFKGGGKRSRVFAGMLHDRRIHYRAFAFAARYLKGLGSLSDKEQRDTRARLWRKPLRELSSHAGCEAMAEKIFKKAKKLSENVPELTDFGRNLRREHILLDLPLNDAVVRGGDILTRTDGGHIGTPNLFFDPEKWSQAYEHQKQCGFVFTPRKHVPVVALASRIVFYESFRIVMDIQAERAAKVSNVVKDEWVVAARDAKFCSPECMEMLTNNSQSRFVRFQANDFEVPQGWSNHDPGIREHLANDLNTSLPSGLVASSHAAVAKAIGDFSSLVQMIEETGTFVGNTRPSESSAQRVIKQHLVSRGVDVDEGTEMAGGETDLVVYDKIVVEIKVSSKSNPFNGPPHASWQARRYSISLCTNVTFVVMVYRPGSEADLHMPPKRVGILELRDVPEERCEVRFAIPWGAGVPSAAKASPGSNIDKSLPDN